MRHLLIGPQAPLGQQKEKNNDLEKTLLPLVAALGLSACVEYGVVPLSQFEPFRAEAERGDAFAQAQLGQHYLGGHDSEEDLEMAVYWLERAAEQNEPQAIYLLGTMREQSFRGLRAALPFYLRAAMLNNGRAQEKLAELFALGAFGKPNYMESYKWYLLAVRHGRGIGDADFGVGEKLSEAQRQMAQQAAERIAEGFTADAGSAS